jgi:iron complex outermembrane receptor protein
MVRPWVLVVLGLVPPIGMAGRAVAEQTSQPSAEPGSGLTEVVVTARRREEKLQSVPIAVTALSSKALDEQHIKNTTDLAYIVPSLTAYSDTGRDEQWFTMRGITNQPGGPGVVAYFNEVPDLNAPQLGGSGATGGAAGPGRFFDLDNVQVLKGPQGTLFGKNTIGGAILLYPKKPTDDYSGFAQATFGNYGNIELGGAVNVPVVPEKLLLRFTGERSQRDGFTTDIQTGKDLDNRDYWLGRLSVVMRPVDTFENYLVVDDIYSHTNGSSFILRGYNPCFSFGPGVTLGQCGNNFAIVPNLAHFFDLQRELGVRYVTGQFAGSTVGPLDKIAHWSISDIATWDINDSLTLKNIFGYHSYKQLFRLSESPFADLDYAQPHDWSWNLEQYTEELQLQGKADDDRLVWQGGFYGSYDHTQGASQSAVVFFDPTAPILGENKLANRSYAVYAQATYDLGGLYAPLDGLKFTAGYRYNWDYRSVGASSETAGVCTPGYAQDATGLSPFCFQSGNANFQAPSWTLGLDYQVTADTLVYVTGRRGYIVGGINAENLIPNTQKYQPEVLDDIELGVKSDWQLGDARVRTNLDVFRSYFKAVQNASSFTAPGGFPIEIVENNGKVTITGVEFEGTIVPNLWDGFELDANYAYTYAHYNEFTGILPPGTVLDPSISAVPLHKFSITAKQTFTFVPVEWGDVSGQITFNYQSHDNFGGLVYFTAGAVQAPYGLVNLRVDWNNVAGYPVDVGFFVTNLLDRLYQAGNFPTLESLGYYASVYGEPRMFGVQLRYRFGGKPEPEVAPAPYTPPAVQAPAPAPKSYLVFFDFNKSDLTPQAKDIVDTAAKNAQAAKVTQITCTGHTDTVGSDAYNLRLSRRRAESVAAQLEKDGIASSEIEIVAKGKRDLLVPTGDGVREPQNRRVQIVYAAAQS